MSADPLVVGAFAATAGGMIAHALWHIYRLESARHRQEQANQAWRQAREDQSCRIEAATIAAARRLLAREGVPKFARLPYAGVFTTSRFGFPRGALVVDGISIERRLAKRGETYAVIGRRPHGKYEVVPWGEEPIDLSGEDAA